MSASPSVKITKTVVDQAAPQQGRHYLWDKELRGFGVCIEKSGTKTYFVRYRPKGHGRDGQRRYYKLGRHGDITPDQARQLAKAALGQVASGGDPAAERETERQGVVARREAPTFKEIAELFTSEHLEVKRKGSTAASYEILFRLHAYPKLGAIKADEVTRAMLSTIHVGMSDTQHSANRLLAVISSLYSFAAKRALVPEGMNPAKGIERYREEGRERYLTQDELQRLGSTLIEAETDGLPWDIDWEGPKAKHLPKSAADERQVIDAHAVAAIRLLLFTGARLREILDLRWQYVDMDRGLLLLPDSKTGKKTIVLSGEALEILRHLATLAAGDRQGASAKPAGYVIKGNSEDAPRADLKKPWRAIRRHAGLEGVRLHDLRHTFASIGAGASLGLPVVGKLLGHSQPQTTARYAHLDTDPLRRAASLIGGKLAAALNQSSR